MSLEINNVHALLLFFFILDVYSEGMHMCSCIYYILARNKQLLSRGDAGSESRFIFVVERSG